MYYPNKHFISLNDFIYFQNINDFHEYVFYITNVLNLKSFPKLFMKFSNELP